MRVGPGYRLGRYELISRLGAGGMGEVWLARYDGDFSLNKRVALKTVLPALVASAHSRKMLIDEARMLARIDHPNVVQLHDCGEAGGLVYLVLEWVRGCSLQALCADHEARGRRLPLSAVLRVLAEAAAGLHAAHELRDEGGELLGLVHRDVSPQNVLVSVWGTVKLIDFGIAKARERIATATTAGVTRGKPSYLAPEQAMGFHVDRRADIWALGATLYRAVSGEVPFSSSEQLLDYVHGRVSLPPLAADVPEPVRALAQRALDRDPAKRFPSADVLVAALEAAAASTGGLATRIALARLASNVAPSTEERSSPPGDAAPTANARGGGRSLP